jgi:hypothetical protein
MSLLSSPYLPVSVSLSSKTGLSRSALHCAPGEEADVRIYSDGTMASADVVSVRTTLGDDNLLEHLGDGVKYALAQDDIGARPVPRALGRLQLKVSVLLPHCVVWKFGV